MVPVTSDETRREKAWEAFQTRMHQLIAEGDILSVISQLRKRREDVNDFLFSAGKELLAGSLIISGNGGKKTAQVNPSAIMEILKKTDDSEKRNQLAQDFLAFCQEQAWWRTYLSLCEIMRWKKNPEILKEMQRKKERAGNEHSINSALCCAQVITRLSTAR